MISWKALRAVCTVLLLLPVVHLAFLMFRETREALNDSPEAWTREVNLYAEADAKAALPEKPLVVVGGRRVKLWPDLPHLLAPRPVLMRGLGSAIIEDITYNYTSLIGYYRPDSVVLLPDNSEFHMRDNKSAPELLAAVKDLADLDASYGVTRKFYVFAPLKTLRRPGDHATIDEAARLLKDWAAANDHVAVLDANRLFAGPDGAPRPVYFRGDGVNLNEHGYLRLSVLLLSALEADEMATAGRP